MVYCSHPVIECFGHTMGGYLVSLSFAVMAEVHTNSWKQLKPLQRAWVESHAFDSKLWDCLCIIGMKIMLQVCFVQAVYLLIQAGAAHRASICACCLWTHCLRDDLSVSLSSPWPPRTLDRAQMSNRTSLTCVMWQSWPIASWWRWSCRCWLPQSQGVRSE